ncbi:MAG TPA: hypothetical protein VGK48_02495 [Terriglobia bacterium]|jgi:chromosome segregation ATPase
MPDSTDNLKNLTSSKDQLAQVSQIAEGIQKGSLPASDVFKIPDQVSAAHGMLSDLDGGPHLDSAKDALDNLTKASSELQDEAMKKLPPPVMSGKDALSGLGKEVGASGDPIKSIAASLPQVKLPIGDASNGLGKLSKGTPSAEKLKSSIPDIQGKIDPLQKQIPDVASQLDPPKDTIQGLVEKLKDVTGKVKPLLDAPPLAQAIAKAGTGDLIKKHLAAAEEKLPQVPPLLDQAKEKLTAAMAPLQDAGKKLGDLQAAAVAAIPPPPNPDIDNLQKQIADAAATATQAAAPVNTAAANITTAQNKVMEAQGLAAKASDQMQPAELKQTMDQLKQNIGDAQKLIAAPAAEMPESAELTAGMPGQLTAIQLAGPSGLAGLLGGAGAGALFGAVQDAVKPLPAQASDAAPAVEKLGDQLPQVSAPLAQALQTMNGALDPQQQDLAELERLLKQAQDQMTVQSQQVDNAAQKMDDSKKKVDGAAAIQDPDELKKSLDDISASLPQLDDQPVSDLEKKLPDLEALLDRIEKSGGAA